MALWLTTATPSVGAIHPPADGGGPSGPAAHCDSVPAATETVEGQVYATLQAPTATHYDNQHVLQRDTLNSVFLAQVLDAFRQGFVPPAHLGLTVYQIAEHPPEATLAVFGEVAFGLTAEGSVAKVQVSQSSLSAQLDKSLVDALHRADSLHSFPPSWAAGNQEPPWFFVSLTTGKQPAEPSIPLFTLRVPVWHKQTLPLLDPNKPATVPNYPSDLVQQGFEGTIMLEFVIDEVGNPVPSTFRLLNGGKINGPAGEISPDANPTPQVSEFVNAITKALSRGHYIPGTVAGCPVKAVVVQPYAFNLRKRAT